MTLSSTRVEIVSASRLTREDFAANSALGKSLRRMTFDGRLTAALAFSNRIGLPEIFNSRIVATSSSDLLVFMHDDVWIDDYFLVDRVIEGLQCFDVIGVAGNRRRVPNQPAWAFVDRQFTWDTPENLSGSVAHGPDAFGVVSHFGSSRESCELLDGVFIAARKSALTRHGLRFDPQFDFHFYDLDFCRSARQAGLRIGTWPICLTHQSAGTFGSPKWQDKYLAYLAKWGN